VICIADSRRAARSQRSHSIRRQAAGVTETVDQLPGAISLVDEDGVPVLRLCGEIDSTVVAAYEDATAGQPRQAAVVDASRVTFLDCRGLGLLVRRTEASRRAGERPVLRRPARIVRRVVDIAGARSLFTVTV
jgi:anti-anti-sigma factor